jgi:AIPR protein
MEATHMNHPLVSIPLQEGRRQNDPCRRNNHSFTGLVPMHEVRKFAPKGQTSEGQTPWVNPRLFDPDPLKNKNKMAREILMSARNEENFGKFHCLNRGITLVAENAVLDNGVFKIDFGPDSKKRGLLDGGTTVSALVAAFSQGFDPSTIEGDENQQFVNLRVFCGPRTEDEIVELSEALNKGRQVNDFALANLDHQFDWIKSALKGTDVKYSVTYATNEPGDIGVDDILQWMSLFLLEKPSIAYSSQNACLKKYLDEDASGNGGMRERYENLKGVLKDIIVLSDYVPSRAKEKYDGNFLLLTIIKDSSRGAYRLPILGKDIPFTPHNAWVFPMISSLRANLDTTKTPYQWRVPVFPLFDRVAHTLVKLTNKSFDGKGTMATLGKNSALYELLLSKVETEVEKMAAGKAAASAK